MHSLSPEHKTDLFNSGLTEETILAAKIYSARPDTIDKLLGFKAPINSLMVFPYPGTDFERYKLFPPLATKEKKKQKYSQPKGSPIRLYVPPEFTCWDPLWRITEGEKKSLKACQEGLNVLGLGGIWNYAIKGNDGEPVLIEDLRNIPWKSKTVEVIPDGDFQTNESVCHAVYRLCALLEREGATTFVVCLPSFLKLDDYLIKYSVEDFLKLRRITMDDPFFRGCVVKEKGLGQAIGESVIGVNSLIAKKLEARPYFLWPWLRPGTLAMIYSARGVGKTFLSIALALAITRNLSIGNWKTDKCAGVLYIDGEMPVEDVQDRVRQLVKNLTHELAPFHILSAAAMQSEG
jgi:AAA domain/Domain of unknown function (DUF3854)